MGKEARARVLADSQAKAVGRSIRTSPRKLNLVAQSIRGKRAEAALAELTFSQRRVAHEVKKVLQSAIANAENNHDLDVDDLVVTEASVGKNMVLKRFHPRARGRGAAVHKPFSQITIVVEEKRTETPAKKEEPKAKEAAKPAKKSGARTAAAPAAKKATKKAAPKRAKETA
ncbi:MAG TPA: 50S ribosomal protein L22 [Rhizomicrobium sp.]|nr:50S ribosomal protein L22 [Rhizomicrobium sp.]